MKPTSRTKPPAGTFPLWASLATVSRVPEAEALQFHASSKVTSPLKGTTTDQLFTPAL